MNKSLSAQYVKLSADQGIAEAEIDLVPSLVNGFSLHWPIESLLRFSMQRSATMPCQRNVMEYRARDSAHCDKHAADQRSVQAQLQSMHCLIDGDGVNFDVKEAEGYCQFTYSQVNITALMRSRIV